MTRTGRLGKWAPPLGGALFLLLLILYMSGAFRTNMISPGKEKAPAGLPEPSHVENVTREEQPIWYEAIGTIRSQTQATVAAQVTGRVVAVNADTGQSVEKGFLLARLDDQEFTARLQQARGALDAARAEGDRAKADNARIQQLFRDEAATLQQREGVEAREKQARAGVMSAEQKVREAEVSSGYTQVGSPITGVVAKREVEPGDLAWPGKPLFVIQHQEDLRLESSVREGLIGEITVGQSVQVHISALDRTVDGRINEIVPSADSLSRSFLVKVSLPKIEGLYPGMFGKLRIRRGERPTILVPERAIQRVGQLTTVFVKADERWQLRYVTVGASIGDRLEILSGLSAGDTIGWN